MVKSMYRPHRRGRDGGMVGIRLSPRNIIWPFKRQNKAAPNKARIRAAFSRVVSKPKNFDATYVPCRDIGSLIRRSGSFRLMASLDALTPDAIAPAAARRSGSGAVVHYAAMALFASVFLYSGYYLIDHAIAGVKAAQSYGDINNIFYEEEPDPVFVVMSRPARPPVSIEPDKMPDRPINGGENGGAVNIDNKFAKKLAGLEKLIERNKDTFGWLFVGMTNIDYPVVQGKDNEFYLNHDFDKKYLYAGSIYADYRNSKNMDENLNTIIYGHNMNIGSTMFRQLLKFRDNKNVFDNGYIELSTVNGIYVYEVFSVYRTSPYYRYIQTDFPEEGDWLEFLLEIQGKSMYRKNVKLTEESRIITLSTCTNTPDDYRFAVHGVLREIIR